MTRAILPSDDNSWILLPDEGTRDQLHRLNKFSTWLTATGGRWFAAPDLAAYRDYLLLQGLSSNSVRAHLSTVRMRYKDLIRDRDLFFQQTPANLDFVERQALVNELVQRIENAITPRAASVRVVEVQDQPDSLDRRLTTGQVEALFQSIDVSEPKGRRDMAIIALFLATGIREGELVNVRVSDLYETWQGIPSLRVREGKGAKARMVPYGGMEYYLGDVERYLQEWDLKKGYAFRGFYKGYKTIRKYGLSERQVQRILADYPIENDAQTISVRPHDLRRTYACRLYEAGMDLNAIRLNLGHADIKTTLHYIGELDAELRAPPDVY